MALNLSKALRAVFYLLAASGLFYLVMPFIDVALRRYDSPVAAAAGILIGLLALPFHFMSRSKLAQEPFRTRPIVNSLLWCGAVVFGILGLRLLYFGVRLYV
jgi:hypothetical protein